MVLRLPLRMEFKLKKEKGCMVYRETSALRQQSVISAPHILIGCVMWSIKLNTIFYRKNVQNCPKLNRFQRYRIFTVNLAITLGSEGLGNGQQHPCCCFMTQKLN